MPTVQVVHQSVEARVLAWISDRLSRRGPATLASACFIVAGLLYFFWWGLHVPPLHRNWNSPGDIWVTLQVAGQVAHGHLSAVYSQYHFATFPGIAFLLAPVAALSSAWHLSADVLPTVEYIHPEAWVLLGPVVLLLSSVPLFGFDALAERLGADGGRRVVLALVEVVALWNVAVFFGHPEDALAVGLMAYAYVFALDGRWNGAAWLFGVAVAFQPLVLAALPILLAVAGVKRWFGFIARAAIPGVVVVLGPLVANFHTTVTALTQQPNFPLADHETPWTALAPPVHIGVYAVAAGPGRAVSLVLACVLGWWSLRWREKPAMLVWAGGVALALRCFTESVMDPYYLWPAIAVALVAAACTRPLRVAASLAGVVIVTVTSQWHLAWAAWWSINTVGLVVVLACAVPLGVVDAGPRDATAVSARSGRGRYAPGVGGTKRRKPDKSRNKRKSRR